MLHEAFVEAPVLDAPALALDVAVAHVDLRSLGKARELLVRRLRREHARRGLAEVLQPHREAPLIERMEFHEAGPGLVEQDVVAQMADALHDPLGVVDRAVIGALLDHRDAERALALPGLGVLDQRIGADALADRRFVEGVGADRADQPEGVALGGQEDRHAAAQQQRAVMRGLVVVAVEQHEIVLGDETGQHDLVRGRRAVEHEIGLLRAEDRRRLLLRLQRRPLVGEEIAEFEDRIVEVVAEHRLAEMLDEDAADRAAGVEDAAVVAGAGPELIALFGVVDERAEERRLQSFGVLLEAARRDSWR